MTDINLRRTEFGAFSTPSRSTSASRALDAFSKTEEAFQFRAMENAFRATGGLAGSEAMTELLRTHTDQPISMLSRWIVAHEIIGFEWQGHMLVPLFQFDLTTMKPRAAVTEVLRELVPVLSDWDVSLWFARPNGWLGDATPVDAIESDPSAVFQAARADRYLAGS